MSESTTGEHSEETTEVVESDDTADKAEKEPSEKKEAKEYFPEKEKAKSKSEEGQVKAWFNKVLEGEEKIEDVPEWLQQDVKARIDDAKSRLSNEELKLLKSEIEDIKSRFNEKSSKEEKSASVEKFNKFLERNGWKKEDFDSEFGDKFAEEMKDAVEKYNNYSDALNVSLGKLATDHGFYSKKGSAEVSQRKLLQAGRKIPTGEDHTPAKPEGGRKLLKPSAKPEQWYKK